MLRAFLARYAAVLFKDIQSRTGSLSRIPAKLFNDRLATLRLVNTIIHSSTNQFSYFFFRGFSSRFHGNFFYALTNDLTGSQWHINNALEARKHI